jgi:hypothetical protein
LLTADKANERRQKQLLLIIDHTTTKSIIGLSDCKPFLSLLPTNASRIACLIEVAKDFTNAQHFMVIQYKSDSFDSEFELAFVTRLQGESKKRTLFEGTPRNFLA